MCPLLYDAQVASDILAMSSAIAFVFVHCMLLRYAGVEDCLCIALAGALMGLSSLAVMGNSLTLQLQGRSGRQPPKADAGAASLPQNSLIQQSLPQQHHQPDAAASNS